MMSLLFTGMKGSDGRYEGSGMGQDMVVMMKTKGMLLMMMMMMTKMMMMTMMTKMMMI